MTIRLHDTSALASGATRGYGLLSGDRQVRIATPSEEPNKPSFLTGLVPMVEALRTLDKFDPEMVRHAVIGQVRPGIVVVDMDGSDEPFENIDGVTSVLVPSGSPRSAHLYCVAETREALTRLAIAVTRRNAVVKPLGGEVVLRSAAQMIRYPGSVSLKPGTPNASPLTAEQEETLRRALSRPHYEHDEARVEADRIMESSQTFARRNFGSSYSPQVVLDETNALIAALEGTVSRSELWVHAAILFYERGGRHFGSPDDPYGFCWLERQTGVGEKYRRGGRDENEELFNRRMAEIKRYVEKAASDHDKQRVAQHIMRVLTVSVDRSMAKAMSGALSVVPLFLDGRGPRERPFSVRSAAETTLSNASTSAEHLRAAVTTGLLRRHPILEVDHSYSYSLPSTPLMGSGVSEGVGYCHTRDMEQSKLLEVFGHDVFQRMSSSDKHTFAVLFWNMMSGGGPLSETDFCRRSGVSRSGARKAFLSLMSEGLVVKEAPRRRGPALYSLVGWGTALLRALDARVTERVRATRKAMRTLHDLERALFRETEGWIIRVLLDGIAKAREALNVLRRQKGSGPPSREQ